MFRKARSEKLEFDETDNGLPFSLSRGMKFVPVSSDPIYPEPIEVNDCDGIVVDSVDKKSGKREIAVSKTLPIRKEKRRDIQPTLMTRGKASGYPKSGPSKTVKKSANIEQSTAIETVKTTIIDEDVHKLSEGAENTLKRRRGIRSTPAETSEVNAAHEKVVASVETTVIAAEQELSEVPTEQESDTETLARKSKKGENRSKKGPKSKSGGKNVLQYELKEIQSDQGPQITHVSVMTGSESVSLISEPTQTSMLASARDEKDKDKESFKRFAAAMAADLEKVCPSLCSTKAKMDAQISTMWSVATEEEKNEWRVERGAEVVADENPLADEKPCKSGSNLNKKGRKGALRASNAPEIMDTNVNVPPEQRNDANIEKTEVEVEVPSKNSRKLKKAKQTKEVTAETSKVLNLPTPERKSTISSCEPTKSSIVSFEPESSIAISEFDVPCKQAKRGKKAQKISLKNENPSNEPASPTLLRVDGMEAASEESEEIEKKVGAKKEKKSSRPQVTKAPKNAKQSSVDQPEPDVISTNAYAASAPEDVCSIENDVPDLLTAISKTKSLLSSSNTSLSGALDASTSSLAARLAVPPALRATLTKPAEKNVTKNSTESTRGSDRLPSNVISLSDIATSSAPISHPFVSRTTEATKETQNLLNSSISTIASVLSVSKASGVSKRPTFILPKLKKR